MQTQAKRASGFGASPPRAKPMLHTGASKLNALIPQSFRARHLRLFQPAFCIIDARVVQHHPRVGRCSRQKIMFSLIRRTHTLPSPWHGGAQERNGQQTASTWRTCRPATTILTVPISVVPNSAHIPTSAKSCCRR